MGVSGREDHNNKVLLHYSTAAIHVIVLVAVVKIWHTPIF